MSGERKTKFVEKFIFVSWATVKVVLRSKIICLEIGSITGWAKTRPK